MIKRIFVILLAASLWACNSDHQTAKTVPASSPVQVAGAMKNVMWKGELGGVINLDTIANREGLYGLGPLSYLAGELLVNDGKAYVSKVVTDSTMTVEETFLVSAPFFVYGHVREWDKMPLPNQVQTIQELEQFIDEKTKNIHRPFAFKLIGMVEMADIHIQNLPEGTKVSSPQEAHQGQTNYLLQNEPVEIVGFFSTEHQGIFTHHDSYLHMHLLTKDHSKMGHLDKVKFSAGKMSLFLPKE